MEVVLWIIFLIASLFVLIRGADVFVVGAKQIGVALGMSKFAIGILIVGFGTSLPELASSVVAVINGSTDIVVANAVGSNITNILLVIGVLATLGGRILIKRDLIKTELPIFFISTIHFLAVVYDGYVDRFESLLLIGTFIAYLWYLFVEGEEEDEVRLKKTITWRTGVQIKSLIFIILGIAAVLIGAHYTIEMVINIATAFAVPLSVISILGIALGTSLPELFVSMEALKTGETDLAIGNIFGSNAFNILVVIGVAGLITPLTADVVITSFGISILGAASAILFVKGLAKQIMRWEGMMLLLFFIFFLVKLVGYALL